MLTGRVLITGGAGYLGRSILRRAEREHWPAEFTVLSRDDMKHAAVQRRFPGTDAIIGDVAAWSVDRLTDVLRGYDTIIHAAAEKHVDRSEHHARATVEANVLGSMNIAEAASRARVRQVVGISTDKAVSPQNLYGASKMVMERIFQEADRMSDTAFTCVRYGNVVGSTGSVVPIWLEAVRRGDALRLTDPGMTRFWMSPDEAVDTVLMGLMAEGGSITIPACHSMTMHDLALMALGYDEHEELPTDGRVEIIGVRPGEKRHEALLSQSESVRTVRVQSPGQESWRWLYIAPPDSVPREQPEFEVTSDQPPLGWMPMTEMRAIIEDARTI